jgi:S1-C subfamily serine protease
LFEFIKALDLHKEEIRLANAEENLSPACSSVTTEITENNKIRIKEINTESAEYKSGLRKGDIISAINGIELQSSSQLSTMFMTLHQGSEVSYYLQKTPAEKDDGKSANNIIPFKKFEREITVRY